MPDYLVCILSSNRDSAVCVFSQMMTKKKILCNYSFRDLKNAWPWEPCRGGAGRLGPGGAGEALKEITCNWAWGAHRGRGGRVGGPVGAQGGPQAQARARDRPGARDPQGVGSGAGAPKLIVLFWFCWCVWGTLSGV